MELNRDRIFKRLRADRREEPSGALFSAYEEVEERILSLAEPRYIFQFPGEKGTPGLRATGPGETEGEYRGGKSAGDSREPGLREDRSCGSDRRYPQEMFSGYNAIYEVLTLGNEACSLSSGYFEKGEYTKGLLADAALDELLFALEREAAGKLFDLCRDRGIRIVKTLEAPLGYPVSFNREIIKMTGADTDLHMSVNAAGALLPEKSMCFIHLTCPGEVKAFPGHDCSKCTLEDCVLRDTQFYTLTIRDELGRIRGRVPCRDTVSTALRENGCAIHMPCGGCGRCGKCRILFTEGAPSPSESDLLYLSKQEIRMGYRLACTSRLTSDAAIRLPSFDESRMYAVAGNSGENEGILLSDVNAHHGSRLAIDIGTTTIAEALILGDSEEVVYGTALNRSRIYGADVLSRVSAWEGGHRDEIYNMLREDVEELAAELIETAGCRKPLTAVISANTAMQHMFEGESCRGLMAYPFDAGDIGIREIDTCKGALEGVPVVMLPGVSAFVGADIVSGLYCILEGPVTGDEKAVFIDVGTNAEMAVLRNGRLYVTSAAAGPAFEGGEISWGMGSIPGAICRVEADADGKPVYSTISDEKPMGICGTGLIDILGYLSDSGILADGFALPVEYAANGYPVAAAPDGRMITVTQKDIEALRLAISAVRTGLEILLKRTGDRDFSGYKAYVAGGFGTGLREESALSSGLLPGELKGSIKALGNASLAGALKYLTDEDSEVMRKLASSAEPVELASEPEFNEIFVRNLMPGDLT
ncbi:MAG: ASKHA domain-containing protein [Lachnospiraceae bacterium]|nr:ASKHA domain-containing protein [Lachnospiraceae bacterium]